MFDSLCFFSASDWHGITYQGGGMGGQHGFAGCYDNVSFSDRDKVIPASTEQLGYKPPKYYGIGHSTRKGELWA